MKSEHDKLEQLMHNTLRSLPDRKAPRTLEHRVLAAIAARQALPWYRQSFAHWPAAARLAFVGVGTALVAAIVMLNGHASNELDTAGNRLSSSIDPFRSVASTLWGFGSDLFERIPSLWLYGGLLTLGAMYLLLFGIGATAYRTLIAHR